MRTYGKINGQWKLVETTPSGDSSEVWLTTLVQSLKLNLGESPFWANYGIPAQQTVMTQVYPDFYVAQTQAQFSSRFLSLTVAKIPGATPHYRITAVTPKGSLFNENIAV